MNRENSSLFENRDRSLFNGKLPFKKSTKSMLGLHEEGLSVGYSIAANSDWLEARPASSRSGLSMNEVVAVLKYELKS